MFAGEKAAGVSVAPTAAELTTGSTPAMLLLGRGRNRPVRKGACVAHWQLPGQLAADSNLGPGACAARRQQQALPFSCGQAQPHLFGEGSNKASGVAAQPVYTTNRQAHVRSRFAPPPRAQLNISHPAMRQL